MIGSRGKIIIIKSAAVSLPLSVISPSGPGQSPAIQMASAIARSEFVQFLCPASFRIKDEIRLTRERPRGKSPRY